MTFDFLYDLHLPYEKQKKKPLWKDDVVRSHYKNYHDLYKKAAWPSVNNIRVIGYFKHLKWKKIVKAIFKKGLNTRNITYA